MASQTPSFIYEFTEESSDSGPVYLNVRHYHDNNEVTSVESLNMWSGPTNIKITTLGVFTSEKLFDAAQKLQQYEQQYCMKPIATHEQLSLDM
jgi:hypothetical protein